MATNQSNSFERIFPPRELFRGWARSSLFWSVLSSISLCLLLIDLFLVAELLESRGRLFLQPDEAQILAELIGENSHAADGDGLPKTVVARRHFENNGVLPSVWESRETFWGPVMAVLYRNVALLRQNSSALMSLILVAVAVGFMRSLCLSRARRMSTRAGIEIVTRLRRSLHRQTLRLGPGDLEETGGEHVLNLFTIEMERVRNGVSLWINRLGRYPFELPLLLILAIAIHWRVALQCLIPLMACWYLIEREKQRFDIAGRLAKARADSELRLLAESLQKTRIVRGYGMEDFEHGQFQKHLERYRNNVSTVKRKERWSRWICRGLVTVCIAIVLFLMGIKTIVEPPELSFASGLLLCVVFACMYGPLEALWRVRDDREEASQSADRIFRYLNRIPDVSQAVGAKFLQPLSRSLKIESVTYSSSDKRKILDGLDLKIRAGKVTSLVSLDPIEARAVCYLFPRFIEPQQGRILFDSEDIAWVTLESLRAETVYVGGTDPFFTGTVLENISCGSSEYSLQHVTEAAKRAHAHSFVAKLPQGYETVLGEYGEQLDPGQAFRLGLARAILRDPALMIIEEPTTPLDSDTKALLDDAYNRIMQDRTVIFLPSRLSTVRRSDTIVFLHQGKVEAVGKHSELVKSSHLYRHWEYIHFNEFRNETE